MVSSPPPVLPETAAPRVEKCPVIDVPCVDERWWPGVRVKLGESEDSPQLCDCLVSQGGRVVAGTEVGEKTEVPETAGSADCEFVLCGAEE